MNPLHDPENPTQWFIMPDFDAGEDYEVIPAFVAGVNVFVYVTDGYQDRIICDYQSVGIPTGVPNNAKQLIGNKLANSIGVPIRVQVGKNKIEDNEQ